MFHLILGVCLASAPDQCAEMLLPQADSPALHECAAQASQVAQQWMEDRPELIATGTECRANADLPASRLEQLAPGLHVHFGTSLQMEETADGRIANLGVVIGHEGVAVIDAGVSRAEGQALHVAIRRLTDLPIRYLVLTHMHPDHSLGAEVMAEAGAQIVAHHALPDSLAARADSYLAALERLFPPVEWIGTRAVMPDTLVQDDLTLDLGQRRLQLRAWPPAHSDSDLTVLDSVTGTLFTGDLVFRDLTPVVDGSLIGWLDWLDRAPPQDLRLIVPGHGPATGSWTEATAPQQALLTAIADQTRAAIADGLAMSQAVDLIVTALQPPGGSWSSYSDTMARNATAAYRELEWE